MYDPELGELIRTAISRTSTEMNRVAPFMASQVIPWQRQLSSSNQLEDYAVEEYFKHPRSFPILLLPWWLEKTLHPSPDLAFQLDLVRSTINGYYYIRLIDNLMDGHATVELRLLPALGFFYSQFLVAYQAHFPAGHEFWDLFAAISSQSADVMMKDASLTDIDMIQFEQVSGKKTSDVRIPLAAVCHKYAERDLMGRWDQFVDAFGCWHQMLNDVFNWPKDLKCCTTTYFLSEANRRKRPTETVLRWIIREGFDWAVECLQTWMAEAKLLAGGLNSPDLAAYWISARRCS